MLICTLAKRKTVSGGALEGCDTLRAMLEPKPVLSAVAPESGYNGKSRVIAGPVFSQRVRGLDQALEAHMDDLGPARLRNLPSVDSVLSTAAAAALLERFGRMASTGAVRAALEEARDALRAGAPLAPSADKLALEALARLEAGKPLDLRPLFNLTGTVLHTVSAAPSSPRRRSRQPSMLCGEPPADSIRYSSGWARRARQPCADPSLRAHRR